MASPLANEKLVIYMMCDPKEDWIAKIKARYPGLDVRWTSAGIRGKMIPASSYPAELWDGATLLLSSWKPPPQELCTKVKFCQLTSAGTNEWKGHATFDDPNVIFCNSSGIHPPQIAEWVVSTWLASQHHLYLYNEHMKKSFWEIDHPPVQDSYGLRVGILGYGSIGRQCARLLHALGMKVYAYTRSERATPESRKDDSGYQIAGIGDPDGTVPDAWFHGSTKADVDRFLDQDLDLLVVSLPLTAASHQLIGPDQFKILSKKKTFVSNIGRGPIIDTAALITALKTGQIRGAAVDVTDPEPLPAEHPLWKAPNLFISPHVSWLTDKYWDRNLEILETNLERLATGKPCINVVDRHLLK